MITVTYEYIHYNDTKSKKTRANVSTEKMDNQYEISSYGYGKSFVKVLQVHRDGLKHSIKEFEISTTLQLNSHKDYKHGDNSDIIATDTQKNTVYLLAKKFGIRTPEEFGMLLSKHFLDTYSQVISCNIHVEEYPWQRITKNNQSHNHAFVFTPVAMRTADISQTRNGKVTVKAGLNKMRVLKSTQSSFENFVRDDFTTLADAKDRIFSTTIDASWEYNINYGYDFDETWNSVKDSVLDIFAGDLERGIPSASVQNTIYLAEKEVLDRIPQISRIEIVMPNIHYVAFDFEKFPQRLTSGDSNTNILLPLDKPSGMIRGGLQRKEKSKL